MVFRVRKRLYAAILLALCLSTLVLSQLALTYAHNDKKCVIVYFLAYEKREHRGSVVRGVVCVEPSKNLSVSIVGAGYGPSVIDSFIVALKTVARLCYPRVSKLHVIVKLPQGFYIKGASGSLLLTMAVLKLLGISVRGNPLSGTGVVSIDGFVDPVGAVYYKLMAARKSGVKDVYVPLLNFAEAHNFTHMHIHYVDTILYFCSNHNASTAKSLSINETVLNKLYTIFLNDSKKFLLKADKYYRMLPNRERESLSSYYATITKAINTTLKLHHYYSAASLSFSLYITVLSRYLRYSNTTFLQKLVHSAIDRANSIYSKLLHTKTISIDAIPYLIVILDRIKDALYYANVFENLTSFPIPSGTRSASLVALASYAYARSLTIATWFKALKIVNSSSESRLVSTKLALEVSWRVLDLVSNTIELSTAYSPLSLDAIATTRSYLASLNNVSIAEKVLRDLRTLLRLNLENLTPTQRILPYLYMLYGDDLRKYTNESVGTQIMFYSLANLVASAAIEIINGIELSIHRPSIPRTISISVNISKTEMLISAFTVMVLITSLALLLLEIIEKRFGRASNTRTLHFSTHSLPH